MAITGGTGIIGSALAERLRARGDQVLIVTRKSPRTAEQLKWDPTTGLLEGPRLEGVDVVVNLAGAPIGDRPWTKARRKILWDSRIESTRVLLEALGRLQKKPRVFVGVGGVWRYGNGGEAVLDEDAPNGTGFLADLAVAWENAHEGANRLGCRTATLRMGVMLAAEGGAFPLMVKPFRVGIGGWLGNGRQFTSWITLRDAVAALMHLIDHEACRGGFNGSVPEPVRNYDWMKALGRALHRPVLAHAPKWALRGAFGELAEELLLTSARVVPKKLTATGFHFQDPEAEAAFSRLLVELR